MITEYQKEIAARLKKCRKENCYTVEDVANVLGISISQYRKIERGEYGLNDEKIIILHEYLGLDPLYLLTGKTDNEYYAAPTKSTEKLNVMQDFFKYITEISKEDE